MSRSLVSSRLTFAANAGPFVPVAAEGTSETDWLPEGAGFEPSVPLRWCDFRSPLTPSARSGNLIAGDGTKNGLSRAEQRTVSKPKRQSADRLPCHGGKRPLDRKSAIQAPYKSVANLILGAHH